MPPKYKLTYFNARGYGETSRLLFALAGVEYEDKRFERPEWEASLKATSPTGQAPILEVDGVVYAQSTAIARYLAHQFGLAGKTPLDQLRADMIVDTVIDTMKPLSPIFEEKDEAKKAEKLKKFEEEQLPGSFQNLEKMLTANKDGNGYFVGDSATWADVFFMYFSSFPTLIGAKIDWSKYPKLAALIERVNKLPQIAEWIEKRPQTQF